MPINAQSLKQLEDATFTSAAFVETMNVMAATTDALGAGDAQLTLDYQKPDQKVKHGDLIPFLTIGLRQAVVPADEIEGGVGQDV